MLQFCGKLPVTNLREVGAVPNKLRKILLSIFVPAIILAITACSGVIVEVISGPDGAIAGATVTFSCLSPITNGVITYQWSFGDGNSGSGQTVTHVYDSVGIFVIECRVLTSETVQSFTKTISVVGSTIYLADNDADLVFSFNKDGSGTSTAFTTVLDDLFTVRTDEEFIYVSDDDTDAVHRGNKNDPTEPFIELWGGADGLASPTGFFIVGDKIYILDYSLGVIFVGNKDGTGTLSTLYDSADGVPFSGYGLFMDETYVYVSGDNTPRELLRGKKDGSSSSLELLYDGTDGVNNPLDLFVQGNYIYVSNESGDNILRGLKDGSSSPLTEIWNTAKGLDDPVGIFVEENLIYIAEYGNDAIQVGNKDGSGTLTTLFDAADGLSDPWGIWID
jgi:hypothetical protein